MSITIMRLTCVSDLPPGRANGIDQGWVSSELLIDDERVPEARQRSAPQPVPARPGKPETDFGG